jgi:hypothetical protein
MHSLLCTREYLFSLSYVTDNLAVQNNSGVVEDLDRIMVN